RGNFSTSALLPRRARRDSVAEGWSYGASNPTTPPLRATPPRRGGECVCFALLRRRARRDNVAEGWSCGASNPPHPAASRHPSSTRRGKRMTLPSCEGGHDATTSRRGDRAAFRTPPPRRFAPPLLDEEGKAYDFALLDEEGTTRQCRGRVVLRR